MKTLFTLLPLLAIAVSPLAAKDPLAVYSFGGLKGNEPELAPANVAPGTTATPLKRGKGLNYTVEVANALAANGWTTSTEPTANDYFEFTISPENGKKLTLETIEFPEFANPKGPSHFTVRSSLDNYTSDLLGPVEIVPEKPFNSRIVELGEQFRDLTDPITFRFIAWGAKSGGSGTWALGNPKRAETLTISGTLAY